MMNVIRPGHPFSKQGLLYPARPHAPHLPVNTPISPNDRTTNAWTPIAWATNIQSRTLDGKFGPAKQMESLIDCWFMATLAAVANDPAGHKILADSIKKVRIEGIDGYHVTFAGAPNHPVFISDQALDNGLDVNGGDADTRLMELAADKFFTERGRFNTLYRAFLLKRGFNPAEAEECLQQFCSRNGIQDAMTHNPMHHGGQDALACFMLTGMYPERLTVVRTPSLLRKDVMAYLNQFVVHDRNGASIVISGQANPLGNTPYAQRLLVGWDVIRTEITANGTVNPQQRAFLTALEQWLETPNDKHHEALRSNAENLRLQHVAPAQFVDLLDSDQIYLRQHHRNMLRSGVQEVLDGGIGYIGFAGAHCGTIDDIDEEADTFAYSETNFPTMVCTGRLSGLIHAIRSGTINLSALEPTAGRDEAESSHAGEKRGRHLRQIHQQTVRDGKIDAAESSPLANLMEMDDRDFWQVYDSDNNGVIDGGELKSVQLRVDRWVDHFELTPIW